MNELNNGHDPKAPNNLGATQIVETMEKDVKEGESSRKCCWGGTVETAECYLLPLGGGWIVSSSHKPLLKCSWFENWEV